MCGIVGIFGDLEYRDKDVLQILMHLCELRGEDSTGYFAVSKDNDEAISHKVVGGTRAMFDTRQFDGLRPSNERIIVGHCRKATIGKVSKFTAHPFTYDHITGVHNGTLRNWRYLLDVQEETDTMTLYKRIARDGLRESLDATDGAYALVYYDESEDTLNFVRNKERPLHYAFSKDYKKVIFASEPWMINIACAKGGLELADLTPKEKYLTTTLPLEEDTWWRIKVGKRGSKDPITFLQDHDEELKGGANPAKYQAVPFQGRYRSPFTPGTPRVGHVGPAPQGKTPDTTGSQTAADTTKTQSSSSSQTTSPSTQSQKDSPQPRHTLCLVQGSKSGGSGQSASGGTKPQPEPITVNGKPVVLGFNGLTMEKKEFETWVDPNCIWCQKAVTFEEVIADPDIIADWTEDEKFICRECMEGDDIVKAMLKH